MLAAKQFFEVKTTSSMTDHDDVEDESKCHLGLHQKKRSVDVVQSELIDVLLPVDQSEYEPQHLQSRRYRQKHVAPSFTHNQGSF